MPGEAGPRRARPVRWSPELGRVICERLAGGTPEAALCRAPGMPSVQAVRQWARREPEFGAAYEAAKETARAARLSKDRKVDLSRRWRKALRVASGWTPSGGAVSPYCDELAELICRRIAGGESVLAIGADPAMPCAQTIYNWVRRRDDFREMYLTARDLAADLIFDLAFEVAVETSEETVRADRLRIQTFRWRAAALAPKKYGLRRALGPTPETEFEAQPFVVEVVDFTRRSEGEEG